MRKHCTHDNFLEFIYTLLSSQVRPNWNSVSNSGKDCGDGRSNANGWPTGHVHHHSYHWLAYPRRDNSSHSLFCHYSAKSLYLHCWAAASSGNSPGNLVQVSLTSINITPKNPALPFFLCCCINLSFYAYRWKCQGLANNYVRQGPLSLYSYFNPPTLFGCKIALHMSL